MLFHDVCPLLVGPAHPHPRPHTHTYAPTLCRSDAAADDVASWSHWLSSCPSETREAVRHHLASLAAAETQIAALQMQWYYTLYRLRTYLCAQQSRQGRRHAIDLFYLCMAAEFPHRNVQRLDKVLSTVQSAECDTVRVPVASECAATELSHGVTHLRLSSLHHGLNRHRCARGCTRGSLTVHIEDVCVAERTVTMLLIVMEHNVVVDCERADEGWKF